MWSSPGLDTWPMAGIIDFATTRMYADDTNLTFTACSIPELQEQMSVDIQCLKN